jgi:hypothetical protein
VRSAAAVGLRTRRRHEHLPVHPSAQRPPLPGNCNEYSIVTEPICPNVAAALASWGVLRGGVPANLVALRMVAAPVVDRSSGYHSGPRGFRLLSDGSAPVEQLRAQVEAKNAATAAGTDTLVA